VPAGQSREVRLVFDEKAFRRWDATQRGWVVDPGEYRLIVAASAEDLRSEVVVRLK